MVRVKRVLCMYTITNLLPFFLVAQEPPRMKEEAPELRELVCHDSFLQGLTILQELVELRDDMRRKFEIEMVEREKDERNRKALQGLLQRLHYASPRLDGKVESRIKWVVKRFITLRQEKDVIAQKFYCIPKPFMVLFGIIGSMSLGAFVWFMVAFFRLKKERLEMRKKLHEKYKKLNEAQKEEE